MLVSYGVNKVHANIDELCEEDRHVSKTASCELRLYEAMSDECWKTTRRVVLSSTADISEPWCISYCELIVL